MRNDLHFATGNNGTGTPLDFFERLSKRVGGFQADMASESGLVLPGVPWFGPDHPDEARRDCLTIEWPTGRPVFLNPPYGDAEHPCSRRKDGTINCRKKLCAGRGFHSDVYVPGCVDFVAKAEEQRQWGVETWALLAARTDVEWFHTHVWDATTQRPRAGRRVEFLKGRLKFRRPGLPDESAPFPSMLVRFDPRG